MNTHFLSNFQRRVEGMEQRVSKHVLHIDPLAYLRKQTQTQIPAQPYIQPYSPSIPLSDFLPNQNNFPYQGQSVSGKSTIFKAFMSGVKFIGMTSVIFAILFGLANFGAYSKMFAFWYKQNINFEQVDETSAALGQIVTAEENPLSFIDGEFPKVNMEVYPPTEDNRLVIPKLNINVPFEQTEAAREFFKKEDWVGLEKQVQIDLENGLVHYPFTANPGEVGNFFLTGHSSYYPGTPGRYKDVFANLGQMVIGDKMVVFFNGKKIVYTVSDVQVVKPTDTWVLDQPAGDFIARLMTCTPVGTARDRLIVSMKQTYPVPDPTTIPEDKQERVFGGKLQS